MEQIMFTAFMVVMVALFLVFIGGNYRETGIKNDCNNFGYVMLKDVKYECKKVGLR